MATKTVATRFRSSLPGSGFDSSGNAKQGKRRVVGTIAVTSFGQADHHGIPLSAADVGLSTIDYISIKHNDEASRRQGRGQRTVPYCFTTADFYLMQIVGAGLEEEAHGASHTLRFEAVGDSADDVELT